MYIIPIFCLVIQNILSIHSKIWIPKYANENTFNEPYDYVNEVYLPNFESFGKNYNYVSISGTSLLDQKTSFVAFAGTQKNNNASSAFTQQSGIIILCSSQINLSNLPLGFDFNCTKLEEKHLHNSDAKYFGSVVRSARYKNDTVAFIYCDPLWISGDSKFNHPNGKCKLSRVKSLTDVNQKEFTICGKYRSCLGGYSVDIISIDQNLNIIFGLPYENSTMLLNRPESSQISKAIENKGDFINFGYSVAFSGDGAQYIASPNNDGYSPFVKIVNGPKFYPTNIKTQSYGGFGTSMDTVNLGNNLYGVIIGAPYQKKQNIPNVGAVFLACKGHSTDMISGDNANDYFGYSLARLGDLDADGSEEFAVSAPSINFDKPGKIYIYKTTKDCQIVKIPVQIYQSKIMGFGIAISRGFDINFNGMPDFFVSSLGYQKPSLFKMPNQEKVSCSWSEFSKEIIFAKDEEVEIKIIFNSHRLIQYDKYLYQVAIDFLNKDEPRFKLIDSSLSKEIYTIKLQALQDVIDMDLKGIPLKVAIKGVRNCKVFNNTECYRYQIPQITWLNCEKTIKLSQVYCPTTTCVSDLNLVIKEDPKGSIIYYGEQKNYQRTIKIIINNNGPNSTSIVYLSIHSKPDLLITNVKCHKHICKKELTATGQNAKVILKHFSLEKREDSNDDIEIDIDILYNKMENVSRTTEMNFNIWGIDDDNNLHNNNKTLKYLVLIKPNLNLSAKKTKEIVIDSRLKPPYLENFKRVPVNELGTELEYSYIIENKGPELKNVQFKFYIPYKTQDTNFILFLLNKVRMSSGEDWKITIPHISNKDKNVSYCKIPTDLINPYKVIGVERFNMQKINTINRLKRSADNEPNSSDNLTIINLPTQMEESRNFISRSRPTLIKCNETSKRLGMPICAEIICDLDVIPTNSEFQFNFRTWLFTKTFFDAQIADLTVMATFQSNLGDLPKGITILNSEGIIGPVTSINNVLFNKMKIREKPIPLWPIIVAIIIGIFLLVIIIVIAYYCGFFKRKRLRKERQKIREKAQKNQEYDDNAPLKSNY